MSEKNRKKVEAMWWDGDDFVIKTEDGQVIQYTDAVFTDHRVEPDTKGVIERRGSAPSTSPALSTGRSRKSTPGPTAASIRVDSFDMGRTRHAEKQGGQMIGQKEPEMQDTEDADSDKQDYSGGWISFGAIFHHSHLHFRMTVVGITMSDEVDKLVCEHMDSGEKYTITSKILKSDYALVWEPPAVNVCAYCGKEQHETFYKVEETDTSFKTICPECYGNLLL